MSFYDFSCEFYVLFLVIADGYVVCFVEEDVCCHEDWVGEEA